MTIDTNTGQRSAGRRRGESQTRVAIMAAAEAGFIADGFERTTIRGVARAAGVDPALVMHFFGSKEKLFAEAMRRIAEPVGQAVEQLDGPPDQMGVRLIHNYLRVWDEEPMADRARLILRTLASSTAAAEVMRTAFAEDVLRRLAGRLPDRQVERAALVGSQMIGLMMMRYIVKIEPLASMDNETVAARVGPTVQRYMTGELG